MTSAGDNNIVIECSPYGDSETEIVNLKSPSYELISMPNIFDYENSISVFISVITLIGIFLIIFIVMKVIKSSKRPDKYSVMKIFLGIFYLIFFGIGIIFSIPQINDGDITPYYIIFPFICLFTFFIRWFVLQYKPGERDKLKGEMVNAFLPGFMRHHIPSNIFCFFLFFLLIPVLRLTTSTLKFEEAFSLTGLLGSYCFLQALNYMYSNSSESETNIYDDDEVRNKP